MAFEPVFDFRSTTIFRAFVLNILVIALIAGMSIELRRFIDVREQTKNLSNFHKMLITIVGTIVIGFGVFFLARILLGYGGGLLAPVPVYPTFW